MGIPNRTAISWLLAAIIAAAICASTLDGPDDITVIQQVADEVAALEQTNKLVLP